MIIDHTHPDYKQVYNSIGTDRYNGAYYYSKEIVKNIIPNVQTDRNWVTINIYSHCRNNSIVFIHNNLRPEAIYHWLHRYEDLVLVCGIPETMDRVKHLGTPIYLPLSVDVKYVEQFKCDKTKNVAFAGRKRKRKFYNFSSEVEYLEDLPRKEFLKRMAEYENIYAVGRAAIEAKILGCNVLPYDDRFPDPSRWKVMDNLEAAEILQKELERL